VRSLFFLRPDIVVVHDQAQTSQAGVKKTFNLNFNAPTVTQSGNTFSAVTGQSKVFMRSILPANPAPTIARLNYNGGTANVSNYQVMLTGATASSFLHVFQVTDASRTQMAGAVYVASTDARAQGVEVDAGSQRWIALSATSSSTPLSGALTYSLPIAGTCSHLIGDLLAVTQYQVTARSSSGAQLQQFLAATGSDGLLSFSTTDPATATVLLTPVGAAP
jgi:hypothetical protein